MVLVYFGVCDMEREIIKESIDKRMLKFSDMDALGRQKYETGKYRVISMNLPSDEWEP